MASGRDKNNTMLSDNPNAASVTSSISAVVNNLYDYPLPTRTRRVHVFSSRFSAPGGPAESGAGCMDIESSEYSPYNSINFRNYAVRYHLVRYQQAHCNWGGAGSGNYASYQAWHKIQRNGYEIPYSATDTGEAGGGGGS